MFSTGCTTALAPTRCLIQLIFGATIIRPGLEDRNTHPLSKERVEVKRHAVCLKGTRRYNMTQHFTFQPFVSFRYSAVYGIQNTPKIR